MYRVQVQRDGSLRKGAKAQKVAAINATFVDDFAIGSDGTLWVTTNSDNRLFAARLFGKSLVVLGDTSELTLAGATAAAFGRGADRHILYVVTSGGLRAPINGTQSEGGKAVAVDTRGLRWKDVYQ